MVVACALTLAANQFLGGCKTSKKDSEDKQQAPTKVAPTNAAAASIPNAVHVSLPGNPGFNVPLKAIERFESFNRMLPSEFFSSSTWASLDLTLADGTSLSIESPKEQFGEADYQLRASNPGIELRVTDKRSQSEKARWGPLARIVVTPHKAAIPTAKPLPITVDGKESLVALEQLQAIPTVPEPRKQRPAWTLPSVVSLVAATCDVTALSISSGDETLRVEPGQASRAFLRPNRKGVWMFSLEGSDGSTDRKRVRGVTGMDVRCTP
jgi:hypothetical protein